MRTGLLAVGLVVFAVATARADVDITKADATFDEGQKLKDAGKLDEACAKFKESLTYNPNAVGTMLNVALCQQQAGHIGSAMRLFTEARDRGKEQNLAEHVKLAEQHLAEIAADVPFLAVAIREPSTDTKLVVNDEVVPIKPDGSASIAVDPGLVTVIVQQPGRVPFETKLDVKKGEHPVVQVEKLKLPVTINKGRRRIGKVLTYGGAGLALVGIGLALAADHNYNNALDSVDSTGKKRCVQKMGTGPYYCSDPAYTDSNQALVLGNVGTGVIVGGVVVAGIGAYLWFFGPHDEKLAIAPQLDPEHAGIVAFGRF
jgi:tetratricopeptide (TPR) repeat protein